MEKRGRLVKIEKSEIDTLRIKGTFQFKGRKHIVIKGVIMRKVVIVLLALLLCSKLYAQDIDLLWKARALKAAENIQLLQEQIKKHDSVELRMQQMIEFAYAAIVSFSDITVKKLPNIILYHLVINYGEDGMLDVVYFYDSKTYDFLGVRVDRLPKNNAVIVNKDTNALNCILIGSIKDKNNPTLVFFIDNPFEARILNETK